MGFGVAVSGAEWVTRLGLPPSLPFAALAFALRFDLREPRIEPMLIGFQQWGQVVIVCRQYEAIPTHDPHLGFCAANQSCQFQIEQSLAPLTPFEIVQRKVWLADY